ncbi:hypothetical protein [Kutzneria chonburiensis]|uniref:Uncharacterized protein n=1 Tax=Kutzneria chonburiensis TaxID=1483604 RepID=A0ABV6MNJ0_9PSEU|nr:hypothetical protein [Kutzneria chonburiensis]
MSQFVAALRGQVEDVQRALRAAREAGHPYEAGLHAGRLADLVDLARHQGVDVQHWVDPEVLAHLAEEAR